MKTTLASLIANESSSLKLTLIVKVPSSIYGYHLYPLTVKLLPVDNVNNVSFASYIVKTGTVSEFIVTVLFSSMHCLQIYSFASLESTRRPPPRIPPGVMYNLSPIFILLTLWLIFHSFFLLQVYQQFDIHLKLPLVPILLYWLTCESRYLYQYEQVHVLDPLSSCGYDL